MCWCVLACAGVCLGFFLSACAGVSWRVSRILFLLLPVCAGHVKKKYICIYIYIYNPSPFWRKSLVAQTSTQAGAREEGTLGRPGTYILKKNEHIFKLTIFFYVNRKYYCIYLFVVCYFLLSLFLKYFCILIKKNV